MNEKQKYEIVKKLVDSNGNKKTAALKIGCCDRHINRLIKGYKEGGKAFFIHGNRERQPVTTLPAEIKQLVLDLYRTKYQDCNLTHYAELLAEKELINISVGTISSILRKKFILSPKAHRSTKKSVKNELKALQSKTKSTKKAAELQNCILGIEEAHPRRPRSAYFGELLQTDASQHLWFGDAKTHLHVTIDDATGNILGAYFDEQETLNGYYNVLHQILTQYGIPYRFLADKRTVFEYKKRNETAVEKDTFTQFGYACKQLGIDIQTTSVPQAKGRVERVFGTLQSRLPVELRLANVSSIKEANEFLKSYIKKFNKQFALPVDNIKSVFETQPDSEKINLILAVLSPRKIDSGCCLKYLNEYYTPVNNRGDAVHYRKNTQALVIRAFDGELYCCINETVYALELLPHHNPYSKDFNLPKAPKTPKKRYIPPMNHPWKQASFERYLRRKKRNDGVA